MGTSTASAGAAGPFRDYGQIGAVTSGRTKQEYTAARRLHYHATFLELADTLV